MLQGRRGFGKLGIEGRGGELVVHFSSSDRSDHDAKVDVGVKLCLI